jgi:hypothetical protein
MGKQLPDRVMMQGFVVQRLKRIGILPPGLSEQTLFTLQGNGTLLFGDQTLAIARESEAEDVSNEEPEEAVA